MNKGEKTRGSILEHAVDLASVAGLEGLSIGTLASQTGLSKSGLFAHFGSKEKLQIETLKAAAESFSEWVLTPALKEPTAIGRLKAVYDAWISWSKSRAGGCIFVAAAVELDDQPGPVRDYVVAAWKRWYGSVVKIAQKAVAEGEFKPDVDPDQFAHEMESVYLGFHMSSRLLREPAAEQRARTAFETLLRNSRK